MKILMEKFRLERERERQALKAASELEAKKMRESLEREELVDNHMKRTFGGQKEIEMPFKFRYPISSPLLSCSPHVVSTLYIHYRSITPPVQTMQRRALVCCAAMELVIFM